MLDLATAVRVNVSVPNAALLKVALQLKANCSPQLRDHFLFGLRSLVDHGERPSSTGYE
jgi:hypothetical protein